MLLHFVSVSGFMEAGRTADIPARRGEGKKKIDKNDTNPDNGSYFLLRQASLSHIFSVFAQLTVNWIGCVFLLAFVRSVVLARMQILKTRKGTLGYFSG